MQQDITVPTLHARHFSHGTIAVFVHGMFQHYSYYYTQQTARKMAATKINHHTL